MNGRSLQVFLASALGGGIGSLAALQMAHAFWWVGMLVGLAVGYLSFEWRKVAAAVPVAWRAARGWKAKPSYWKSVKYVMSLGVVAGSWIAAIMAVLSVALLHAIESLGAGIGYSMVPGVLAMSFAGGLAIGIVCSVIDLFVTEESLASTVDFYGRFGVRGILSRSAPVVLFWTIPRALPSATVATIRFVRSFSWYIFVQIHSDARLICGTDAMLGSGIGYLSGSVIAGMIAGGVLGLANYELVTRRWLVPAGYVPVPIKVD